MAFFVTLVGFTLTPTGLISIALTGLFSSILLILKIDRKEEDILALGNDMTNFESIFDVELFLVVMLHELERLVQNEDYAHEKHIHAILGRHMEECTSDPHCVCKTYEPEYDKKFT